MPRPGLFVVTQRGALAPASPRTQQEMADLKLRPGDLVSVQVIRSRNPKLCALANAVIAKVADSLGVPSQTVRTKLKLALGYSDLIERQDGTIEERPQRMTFEDMPDEDAFIEFWRATEMFVGHILPELDPQDQEAIVAMLDGRRS